MCFAAQGAKAQSQLGKGLGSFLRKVNIQRHAQSAEHKASVGIWKAKLIRAEANGVEIVVSTGADAAAESAGVSIQIPEPVLGHRAIIATRVLMEKAGSFRSIDA